VPQESKKEFFFGVFRPVNVTLVLVSVMFLFLIIPGPTNIYLSISKPPIFAVYLSLRKGHENVEELFLNKNSVLMRVC
jgi:hypothetical protein